MSDPSEALFFELFEVLPRGGPGSEACTRRALAALPPPGPEAHIAVMGCGVGEEVATLAAATEARISAVDTHQPFLDALPARVPCAARSRVHGVNADMGRPPFEAESLDVVWAESSAYAIGVEVALAAWRPLLRPGGHLVLSDAVWLVDAPSAAPRAFWAAYPDMQSRDVRLAQLRAGFEVVEAFVLPESAWDTYYDPIRGRLPALEALGSEAALGLVAGLRSEMDLRRSHGREYGYLMVVLRKTESSG